MLSTRSWPIMGTCWWWSISPSPPRALAVAVAQDMGITVGYLPGLSMRRIADLAPGSAKTDAKDAAVIAGAARTMPQTLRAVSASNEDAAALSMLTGFDLDLARAVNQTKDRIRGQWLTPDPTPVELKRADKARTGARLKARGCRRHATWAGQDRLSPETSECHCRRHRRRSSGSDPPGQAAHRPTRPAGRYRHPGRWPWRVAHPHVPGPDHTCPGSGVPAAAVLAGPDPGQGPPGTGAQLASYAGLAPVTRRSGSSIRGEHVSHAGNKRLKHAMLPSAVASLRSAPVSRAYYQRKRDQGKPPWARPSPPRPTTAS